LFIVVALDADKVFVHISPKPEVYVTQVKELHPRMFIYEAGIMLLQVLTHLQDSRFRGNDETYVILFNAYPNKLSASFAPLRLKNRH
jgi:hypothetical protein